MCVTGRQRTESCSGGYNRKKMLPRRAVCCFLPFIFLLLGLKCSMPFVLFISIFFFLFSRCSVLECCILHNCKNRNQRKCCGSFISFSFVESPLQSVRLKKFRLFPFFLVFFSLFHPFARLLFVVDFSSANSANQCQQKNRIAPHGTLPTPPPVRPTTQINALSFAAPSPVLERQGLLA